MKMRAKTTEEPKVPRSERIKLVYDFLKHLTTLSSGSILVVAALSEKLFRASSLSGMLLTGITFFLIAIGAAIIPMAILAIHVDKRPDDESVVNAFAFGFALSSLSFMIGMGSVAYAIFGQHG